MIGNSIRLKKGISVYEKYSLLNLISFLKLTYCNNFRETKGGQMSLVFECEKSGLKNMDMDLIQYMIKCFEDYFPYCLNYILVIEMSWVLNGNNNCNSMIFKQGK